jgi:hypothetical protein
VKPEVHAEGAAGVEDLSAEGAAGVEDLSEEEEAARQQEEAD